MANSTTRRFKPPQLVGLAVPCYLILCILVGKAYYEYPSSFILSGNFSGFQFGSLPAQNVDMLATFFLVMALFYVFTFLVVGRLRIIRKIFSRRPSNILSHPGTTHHTLSNLTISYEPVAIWLKYYFLFFTVFIVLIAVLKISSGLYSFEDRLLKQPVYIFFAITYSIVVSIYLRRSNNILSALLAVLPMAILYPLLSLLEVTRDYLPGMYYLLSSCIFLSSTTIRRANIIILSISTILALIFSAISRISSISDTGLIFYLHNIAPQLVQQSLLDVFFYSTGFSFLNNVAQLSVDFSSYHSWFDLLMNLQPFNPSLFGIYSPLNAPLFDPVRPFTAFAHFYSLSPALPLLFLFAMSFTSACIMVRYPHPLMCVLIASINLMFIVSLFQYFPRQCIRFLQANIFLFLVSSSRISLKIR